MKVTIRKILNFREFFPSDEECGMLAKQWTNVLLDQENLLLSINFEKFPDYINEESDLHG